MTGGTVVVNGPTDSGNGALDVNGTFDISGGVAAGRGQRRHGRRPGHRLDAGLVSATLDSSYDAGYGVEVTADDGTVVASLHRHEGVRLRRVSSSSDIVNGQIVYGLRSTATSSGSAVAREQTNEMGGLSRSLRAERSDRPKRTRRPPSSLRPRTASGPQRARWV